MALHEFISSMRTKKGIRNDMLHTRHTIVLIHGAWVTPQYWEPFKRYYEQRGYHCLAPAWPYFDRSVAELNQRTDPRIATLGIKEIADYYAAIITKLDEPPILIGHSFGGLLVQLLLDRGLGACGIAIESGPPRGVFPGWSAIRKLFGLLPTFLHWGVWKKTVTLSFGNLKKNFAQAFPEAAQRKLVDAYLVPAPGKIFFQLLLSREAAVNFANEARAPLLFIAGERDNVVPPGMNRANFTKYRSSKAITEFKEFPQRTHLSVVEPGWEEIADYAITWAEKILHEMSRD